MEVALVEAGPDDRGNDAILRLDRWMELLESGYDWDYPIEEQENGNSFMRHARAKVMGGCSSHNSCIAFWAPGEDIDEWEQKFGATGWNSEMAYRLYKQLETNEDAGPDAPHHGDSGPVHLMNVPPADPSGRALLDACEQAGIPSVRFNSGETVDQRRELLPDQPPGGRHPRVVVGVLHPPDHGPEELHAPDGPPGQRAELRRGQPLHRRGRGGQRLRQDPDAHRRAPR